MTKSLKIALFALAFATTNAFAAYGDHALLRGQSWGPDAQIFAGSSAQNPREGSASRVARERTSQTAAAGGTARPAAGGAARAEPAPSPFAPHGRGNRSADSSLWGI